MKEIFPELIFIRQKQEINNCYPTRGSLEIVNRINLGEVCTKVKYVRDDLVERKLTEKEAMFLSNLLSEYSLGCKYGMSEEDMECLESIYNKVSIL